MEALSPFTAFYVTTILLPATGSSPHSQAEAGTSVDAQETWSDHCAFPLQKNPLPVLLFQGCEASCGEEMSW